MLKKLLFLIALCLAYMPTYAQTETGSTRGPAYAYRTSGENGIVSFPMNTFTPTMLYSQTESVRTGTFVEGSYYVLSSDYKELFAYDLSTGKKEKVMDINGEFFDMTYDYSTQSLLLIQYIYPGSALVRLDLTTGEYTTLCNFDYSMFAVAAGLNGDVYVADMWGEIYKVNTQTGALTSIVNTDQYASSNVMRSLDCDVETGKLYFISNTSYGGCTMYEIDPDSKTFTTVGEQSNTYVGLYTGYTKATPSSPSAPISLTASPASDGSNKCTLTWTCPSTTFNRQALVGLTQATIYRDGEVIGTTEDVAPGQQATYIDDTATAGTHTYKVTLSSPVGGEGMFAITSQYVGKDVPAAPIDVVATATDKNTIKITWKAPDKGLNGGFFSTEDLTYNVIRNDGKVLAKNTTETSATDIIDGAYAGYSYTVTAINDAGEGGSTTSNTAATGNIQSLPLETGFYNDNEFNTWTVYDANNDGNTWMLGTKWGKGNIGAEVYAASTNDDWLISPPASIQAGVPTRIQFGAYCTYYCTEKLEVYIAPAGTPASEVTSLGTIEIKGSEGGYYGDVINKTFDIPAVETSGNYSIYLRYAGGYSTQGMHINDFVWKENNSATISGKVENFMMGLSGATVQVGDITAKADLYGNYTIDEIPAGDYDVSASYQGYKTATEHVSLKAGDNVTVNFMLELLESHTVTGTVTDEAGEPIKGAKVSLTGYENVTGETDAEGKYSIEADEAEDYELSVIKNNYKSQTRSIDLDTDKSDENFSLAVDVLPPYSVTAADNNDGTVAVNWDKPRTLYEQKYDDGTPVSSYGYGTNFSGSQIIGTIFPGETTVRELKWWTTGGEGCEDNITLMLIDLNWGGQPTGEVLYQANVTTKDGQWNTFRLPESLYTEKGFLFAIAGKNNVATDKGTDDGTVDHPMTQVYTTSYDIASSYNYIDDTSEPSRHLLLRAVCENVEPEDATTPHVTYNVYRLPVEAKNHTELWKQIADETSEMTFKDSNIPSGKYFYAVKAVYGKDKQSVETYSDTIEYNMKANVTFNVTANSKQEHAEGATVRIFNESNSYTANVNEGSAKFTNVEKGIYSVTISQKGFNTIEDEELQITGDDTDFSYNYTLTQSLDQPANLDVLVNGDSATLVWNMQQNIEEGFEGDDYTDFEVNPAGSIGWTYNDNDGLYTWGFGNTTFPHMGEPMAAIIFNPATTTPPLMNNDTGEVYETSHSGERALGFFASRTEDGVTVVESDDYLFSPELHPYRDFKFSFWARTYDEYEGYRERIRVGYSTTTTDLNDITWLDSELQYVPLEYTYYEYDIPKDAKYVVLNSSSKMNFLLLVDDIFIGVDNQVKGNSYMPVNVLGYEVYLDGEKVADTNDTEYTFRNLSNGTHTASVVQKFDTGNSAQLTISFDILTTGIKTVADNLLAIYTNGDELHIDGEYINGVVYSTSGAAVMNLDGATVTSLSSLPNGIYIVKAKKADGKIMTAKITK